MRYRKKPVIIEAFQYDGDLKTDQGYYVPEWAAEAYESGDLFYADAGDLYIKTLEGNMMVSVSDYVICGVQGEIYPCKADIFGMTYEPAY